MSFEFTVPRVKDRQQTKNKTTEFGKDQDRIFGLDTTIGQNLGMDNLNGRTPTLTLGKCPFYSSSLRLCTVDL